MTVSMRQMLEAGVHFGHATRFWSPKMAPYIFGSRNKIHIINLEKTSDMLSEALNFISSLVAGKGTVMFVGTKRAASKTIREEAERCEMPFVDFRWLGGMLTNFKTVKRSINRLIDLEIMTSDGRLQRLTKKEGLRLAREQQKLENALHGIKHMRRLPDALFIVDIVRERNAVMEAKRLGIPVVAIVDTNADPDLVDYIIPGNDDGIRAIKLYTQTVADTIVEAQASITTGAKDEADKTRRAQ